jgi:hypothetical protein
MIVTSIRCLYTFYDGDGGSRQVLSPYLSDSPSYRIQSANYLLMHYAIKNVVGSIPFGTIFEIQPDKPR